MERSLVSGARLRNWRLSWTWEPQGPRFGEVRNPNPKEGLSGAAIYVLLQRSKVLPGSFFFKNFWWASLGDKFISWSCH